MRDATAIPSISRWALSRPMRDDAPPVSSAAEIVASFLRGPSRSADIADQNPGCEEAKNSLSMT